MINKKFQIIFLILVVLLSVKLFDYIVHEGFLSKYIKNHSIDQKLALLGDVRSPDIFVFGSSLTERGINAKTISYELSSNNKFIDAFNFSLASGSLMEQSFLLEYLIENKKKPQAIIVSYSDNDDFLVEKDKNIYYASLYVYDKVISYKAIFNLYYKYDMDFIDVVDLAFAKTFKLYLYRKDIKNIFKKSVNGDYSSINQLSFDGQYFTCNTNGDVEGYIVSPLNKFKNHYKRVYQSRNDYVKKDVNFKGMRGLNRIVDIANENGVKVFLTYIPARTNFALAYNNDLEIAQKIETISSYAKLYSSQKNIQYINSITKELLPLSTTDTFHLNVYKSRYLSLSIAQQINGLLSQNQNNSINIRKENQKNNYYIVYINNLSSRCIKDEINLENMLNGNDYEFHTAIENKYIHCNDKNLDFLVDMIFENYIRNDWKSTVRFVGAFDILNKLDLDHIATNKLLTLVENNVENISNPRKTNAILKFLNKYNSNRSEKLIAKIIQKQDFKNDWSPLIHIDKYINHNFIDLNKSDREFLKHFIDSGVIK